MQFECLANQFSCLTNWINSILTHVEQAPWWSYVRYVHIRWYASDYKKHLLTIQYCSVAMSNSHKVQANIKMLSNIFGAMVFIVAILSSTKTCRAADLTRNPTVPSNFLTEFKSSSIAQQLCSLTTVSLVNYIDWQLVWKLWTDFFLRRP